MLLISKLGLRRFARIATLVPVLGLAAVTPTLAQSLDIPLQLVDATTGVSSTGVPNTGVRLIVNVGIGGAQPYPYLFDTGSNLFNAAYLPASGKMLSANFGNVPSSMANLPTGVVYGYTDGNYYVGDFVTRVVIFILFNGYVEFPFGCLERSHAKRRARGFCH